MFFNTPYVIAYGCAYPYTNPNFVGQHVSQSFPGANYSNAVYTAAITTPISGAWNVVSNTTTPINASTVILIGSHSDSQNGGVAGYVYIQLTNSSSKFLLMTGGQGGGSGAGIGASQGIFPLNTDGTIFFNRQGSNFNNGWAVAMVGYQL